MTNVDTDATPRRRGPGRPRNAEATRPPQREAQRAGRTATGRVQISDDVFWFDETKKPEGVAYQWNVVSVLGNEEISRRGLSSFMRNGWTPVPASRHPELGSYGKAGPDDHIIVGGQMLMERPIEMTEEAETEDYDKAIGQVTNQYKRLELDDASMLPRKRRDGSSMVHLRRERAIPIPEGDGSAYERD